MKRNGMDAAVVKLWRHAKALMVWYAVITAVKEEKGDHFMKS